MTEKASPASPTTDAPAAADADGAAAAPTPRDASASLGTGSANADAKPEGRASKPPRKTSLHLDDVVPLWDAFRAGSPVRCPTDEGALALSVDGNNAYRLVCTQCGTASPWFEAAPAGIRLRTIPPGPDDAADDI